MRQSVRAAIGSAAILLGLGSISANAQPQASETTRQAMAAGYKALSTCSATFNAGQTQAEIDANELDGIYTDYQPIMAELSDANINDRGRHVSVRFKRGMPPRIAKWRPGLGCVLLPVGALPKAADWLPKFSEADTRDTGRDVSTALGDSVTITENLAIIDRLGAPVTFAFDGQTYGDGTRTSAVIVLHKGQVIAEQYDRGIGTETPQRTWSVAKALTSTIIGAAVQTGLVGLDNEAVLKDWNHGADPRRAITLRHLLNMASGLESGEKGSRTDRIYFGGAKVEDLLDARSLEAEPGKRFKYSNYDTLIAMRSLRETLDDDSEFYGFPYQAVLSKIGASRTILETDWGGDFVSSSQVWMTARDMARLGQLYLQNGKWGDEQILPADWIDFVTEPAPAQPTGDWGYAGAFWLLDGDKGAPEDAYMGVGNRGQFMVIVPSRDVVLVRRGFDVAGQPPFKIAEFTRDIVAVLDQIEAERIAALTPVVGEDDDGSN